MRRYSAVPRIAASLFAVPALRADGLSSSACALARTGAVVSWPVTEASASCGGRPTANTVTKPCTALQTRLSRLAQHPAALPPDRRGTAITTLRRLSACMAAWTCRTVGREVSPYARMSGSTRAATPLGLLAPVSTCVRRRLHHAVRSPRPTVYRRCPCSQEVSRVSGTRSTALDRVRMGLRPQLQLGVRGARAASGIAEGPLAMIFATQPPKPLFGSPRSGVGRRRREREEWCIAKPAVSPGATDTRVRSAALGRLERLQSALDGVPLHATRNDVRLMLQRNVPAARSRVTTARTASKHRSERPSQRVVASTRVRTERQLHCPQREPSACVRDKLRSAAAKLAPGCARTWAPSAHRTH